MSRLLPEFGKSFSLFSAILEMQFSNFPHSSLGANKEFLWSDVVVLFMALWENKFCKYQQKAQDIELCVEM